MEEITITSLLSVSGSVAAVGVTIQFVKIFVSMSNSTTRQLAAALGAVFMVGATVWTSEVTVPLLVSAIFTGMFAGIAASQSYEMLKDGVNHETWSRPELTHRA